MPLFSKARNKIEVASCAFDFVPACNDSVTALTLLCYEALLRGTVNVPTLF